MIRPIFIFSLPRSGSTLLQRLLTAHNEITSAAETWILLPLFYISKNTGTYTEYMHWVSNIAIRDFLSGLSDGNDTYYSSIRNMVLNLYAEYAEEHTIYFIDKTPRYYLIIDEIIETFPDGKFIFLWRNPLAVAASIIQTWGKGHWNLYRHHIDLFDGVEKLTAAYLRHKKRSLSINYEDLVTMPEQTLEKVFCYLDIEYSPNIIKKFVDVRFSGRAGDPTGIEEYHSINQSPINKWKKICTLNVARITWFRAYVKWVGTQRMNLMGNKYLKEIEQAFEKPYSWMQYLPRDIIEMFFGYFYVIISPFFLREHIQNMRRWWRMKLYA